VGVIQTSALVIAEDAIRLLHLFELSVRRFCSPCLQPIRNARKRRVEAATGDLRCDLEQVIEPIVGAWHSNSVR
jgi:hypothetical protein